MDSGAALRASAISEPRSSIRYWSTGAMAGYEALASCPRACHTAPSKMTSAALLSVIVLRIFRCIDFSLRYPDFLTHVWRTLKAERDAKHEDGWGHYST